MDTPLAVGLFIGCLALVMAALAGWRAARLARRLETVESRLERLQGDLETLGAGGLDALERLDRAEPALERLGERLDSMELRTEGRPYEQAVASARAGAAAADLERNFGLTPAEASLIAAVHGTRQG